ncbi:MAG: hypothetical protein PWQ82_1807 [Thermosediminibacterales bacterium]|nr:hypothetical protein [Thermosediminibacterales bacterium]MDK2835856.1 hypothetical protein [Thermosediminibacterales bacterium]
MGLKNLFVKLIKSVSSAGIINKSNDLAYIKLPCLDVLLKREIVSDQPHEIHVIVPRAEIRKTCFPDGKTVYELIYSSVTIVSSSSHPLAGPQKQKPNEFDTEKKTPNGIYTKKQQV